MPTSFKKLRKLVTSHGWYLDRKTGSHEQYKHPTLSGTVTIAGKDNENAHPKTEASILRQAGLKSLK